MRHLIVPLVFALGACGGSSSAAPTETSPAASGTDTPATVAPDPRLVCARDEDCQLIPSCDCTHCVASKQMDVEPCPNVCALSPCAGQVPRCRSGACAALSATAPESTQ